MLFYIKELGISATYQEGIFSLSSGLSVNIEADEGFISESGCHNGIYSIEGGRVSNSAGDLCCAVAIKTVLPNNIHELYVLNLEEGGYKRYSSDMADGAILSMYGWDAFGIEGLDVHKDPRYNINYSLDKIKAGKPVPHCKAVLSCAGEYGNNPRIYFVKGRVADSYTKGVSDLEAVLKAVEENTYYNMYSHRCTGTKYTISEYKGYYLLTHYYGQCPDICNNDNEPLRLYYRINKDSLGVTSVKVNNVALLVESFIGVGLEAEILHDRGIYGKNSVYSLEDMCGELKSLYHKEDLQKISDAVSLVLSSITKYSAALCTDVDYFEYVTLGGELVYDSGESDIFSEVERKVLNPNGVYLCASPMVEELGFARNENDRTGLRGSVAVCIARYDSLF